MSDKNLGTQALEFIYKHWRESEGHYPSSKEIADALGITVNHWGQVRANLIRKKLLKKSEIWKIEFTDETHKLLERNFERVEQTLENNYVELRLFGAVKAGSGSRVDDLRTYPGDVTVPVLYRTVNPSNYYVLEVEGTSMVNEQIFPGNFVIVQKVTLLEINDGDLIVAKYLPDEYTSRDELLNAMDDPHKLRGPTLKYFHSMRKGSGELIYRLSWRTDPDKSEFKILTQYIHPEDLGKVVAVYRPESQRLI